MRRVHVIGGPGSGKTTLARRLGDALGVPTCDLDAVAYPAHRKRPGGERRAEAERIAAGEGWVTEGIYLGWVEPLLERADAIVWLDVPWRVAAWRIATRHLAASLAGTNEHAGWRRLAAFLAEARRYYAGRRVPAGPEDDGSLSRAATDLALGPYRAKVVRCRCLGRGAIPPGIH
ncbi:MAG TPA: hypothetical protein VFW96_21945 [Thermomicrobiales bacterium]|nr:hypothetical protein [Thermomicrobiales bacterium]